MRRRFHYVIKKKGQIEISFGGGIEEKTGALINLFFNLIKNSFYWTTVSAFFSLLKFGKHYAALSFLVSGNFENIYQKNDLRSEKIDNCLRLFGIQRSGNVL